MGQQPRGLVCPGTSNWRDWDPGAECLNPAAAGIHTVHMLLHVFFINRPLISQKGNQRPLVLSAGVCVSPRYVCMCSFMFPAVSVCIYTAIPVGMCVYKYVSYLGLLVCGYWEYMLDLLVGPGRRELQQPDLHWVTRSGPPNKTNDKPELGERGLDVTL